MSRDAGISRASDGKSPLYAESPEWKEVATIAHAEVQAIFELREEFYGITKGLLTGTTLGRKKLYLLIAKQGLYLVRSMGRAHPLKVSREADLAGELSLPDRALAERQARQSAALVDTAFDCGVAVAGWVLGAYTGGLFLLVAGVGAAARCAISATKWYEGHAGSEQSMFDTPAGHIVDTSVTAVTLTGGLGAAGKTAFTAIRHWNKVSQVMSPAISQYYSKSSVRQAVKFLVVEMPGVGLTSYDLLSPWRGAHTTGSDVRQLIERHESSACYPLLPSTTISQNPLEWFQAALAPALSTSGMAGICP